MWFLEWPLFRGKNVSGKAFGTKISVRCPKFRGGRFSEVGNWDFNSRPEALSALGSVSASRSVRVWRFYYTVEPPNKGQVGTSTNVHYYEVVLFWGVSAKDHLFCILGHTKQNTIHYHSDS